MSGMIELTQSQRQELVLTPQLQQSLAILRCNAAELDELIEEELKENPALERAEETPEVKSDAAGSQSPDDLLFQRFSRLSDPGSSRIGESGDESEPRETQQSAGSSLTDHLLRQLLNMRLSDAELRAAKHIVGNLDGDGYLDGSLAEILKSFEGSKEQLGAGLEIVQTLDPAGVGARCASECLLLQLDRAGFGDSLAARIAANRLELVAGRSFRRIAELENAGIPAVMTAVRIIKSMRPFPGREFSSTEAPSIRPDVTVLKLGDDYVVMPAGDGAPKLRISGYYRDLAGNPSALDSAGRMFLRGRIKSASWFVRSILQREQTVSRIAAAIVRRERNFFDHGYERLEPLRLKDIACEVGVHESTVSRAIANKFIETPRGIFEFKFFFTPRIASAAGERSSASIREQIRGLIGGENPRRPLSDQALAEIMKAAKISIARRTITKYREGMRIPTAARRKGEGMLFEPAHVL